MVSILTTMRGMAIVHALFAVTLASAAFAQTGKPDPEEMIALLRAGNFAELDARASRYQAAYEASSEAEWDLLRAFAVFERVEPDLEAPFNAWVAARPQSYSALAARGAYFYRRGWSARGGDYAADVPSERFDAMGRHFKRAQRDFDASLKLTPRPQLSHRYLIGIAMATGDKATARRFYDEALRGDPESYAARRAYLNALRPEWGGSKAAMRALVDEMAALAQTPKLRTVQARLKAGVLGWSGVDAHLAKDYPSALSIYTVALAEADDAIVLTNRGKALVQLGRLDEALRDFDRALALEPTLSEALEQRGNLRERQKHVKEAMDDYERAAVRGSRYAMQRLGIIYLTDVPRNYREAAKWLQLGAEFGDHRAQNYLGWMYSAGAGVPRDGRRALELWYASAAQGNQDAQKYLDDVPWYWRARYKIEELWPK
jgi:tetratricopeptide (TPR) repeat protein